MAVFLVGMAPAIAAGGTIYVDADASSGGDGTSWGTAYKYLQDALAAAVADDEIWVAEGTYKPDENTANPGGTGSRTATFGLKNGVGIYGGFAGGESSLDERDWQTNDTILSGDIGTIDDPCDNSYHVVTGSGTGPSAVLDGFTITAGNANGSYPWNRGGGMYNGNGSPTLVNCTFVGNYAKDYGGGMCNWPGSPTITNCTFIGNRADYEGGGMYNYSGSDLNVTNCTFSGNKAEVYGGGVYNYESSPEFVNCTLSRNEAYIGGGMYNNYCISTLTNCILWGDTPQEMQGQAWNAVVTYSDVQGSSVWPGTGNINLDPLFVDPNGADDIAGTADDDVRLSLGSPCIDAGDNTPLGVTTDLDGRTRIVDGDCNGIKVVDMGAYEFAWAYIGDFDYQCDVDLVDFAIFALAWLTEPGDWDYLDMFDISIPQDRYIDWRDLGVIVENWLAGVGD